MKRILLALVLALSLCVCAAAAEEWFCPNCGAPNRDGEECESCGTKNTVWTCPACDNVNAGPFCVRCGQQKPLETDDFTGNWKFELGEFDVYLMLKEDNSYILTFGNGGMQQGTYVVSKDYLTLISDELIQTFEYKISRNYLTLESLGPGLKTEESPAFTMMNIGTAMDDTMKNQELVTVTLCSPSDVERFDIVAVNYPNEKRIHLKRAVGFPGNVIEIREGFLYVDGEKQDEPYINDAYRTGKGSEFGPYTVPEGCIFVLGDHRNESEDSRDVGAIPTGLLLGVVEKK